MFNKSMFKDLWENQEIPGHVGLLHESGNFYEFDNHHLKQVPLTVDADDEPEAVSIFDRCQIFNRPLEVICGEGLGFGSNGFVLLLNTETNTPIWSFFSGESNPFYKLLDTGQYIVAISTSGSLFRCRVPSLDQPLREVFLSIT